jgi:hypothetical protein
MDLSPAACQHARWRDESAGAVQAHGIVVVRVLLNQLPRVRLSRILLLTYLSVMFPVDSMITQWELSLTLYLKRDHGCTH